MALTGSLDKDICRICHCEGDMQLPLISPCFCAGSLKYVHQACLQQWIKSSDTKCCELCKFEFIMNTKVKPFTKVGEAFFCDEMFLSNIRLIPLIPPVKKLILSVSDASAVLLVLVGTTRPQCHRAAKSVLFHHVSSGSDNLCCMVFVRSNRSHLRGNEGWEPRLAVLDETDCSRRWLHGYVVHTDKSRQLITGVPKFPKAYIELTQ